MTSTFIFQFDAHETSAHIDDEFTLDDVFESAGHFVEKLVIYCEKIDKSNYRWEVNMMDHFPAVY